MEFQLGSMFVKISVKNEVLVIVFPVSDHMVAIKAELFRQNEKPSVNIDTDIYHKDDILAVGKVEREIQEVSN